ncbi:MAG: FAD:protein FMN transferase [Pseudomonadota bacterium]
MSRFSLVALALFVVGCNAQPQTITLSGATMGTTYSITALDPSGEVVPEALGQAVEATLATVNGQMSNWDPTSEISRVNSAQTTDPIAISAELAEVLDVATRVHAESGGQFDVTLGPLIDLWGFGERRPDSPIPADDDIQSALRRVGLSNVISLSRAPDTLTKRFEDTEVYLAAIAKGYGVDAVAAAVEGFGLTNYLVEIGGDLIASGNNPQGEPWRIGVERPDPATRTVEEVVIVSGLGMATSGDYRNFFEDEGVRYSHIIDAQTGRPITHDTASVTVLAESAMLADAWATALLVLGSERGLDISENLDLAVLFIVRDPMSEGTHFKTITSSRFATLQSAS